MKIGILLASVALPVSTPAVAGGSCVPLASLVSATMFSRYLAPVAKGPWRAPDVSRSQAHLYRTVIRDQSFGSPDFAGRFKLIRIGCGAGTICPAFADRVSGRVTFVPALREVSWNISGPDPIGGSEVQRLTYRRDSRLLVVFGQRNEDERSAGVSLYDWRGTAPRLVRFVPATALCKAER